MKLERQELISSAYLAEAKKAAAKKRRLRKIGSILYTIVSLSLLCLIVYLFSSCRK